MLVTKSIEIDLGHRVTNHRSKCKNLHGHRYKIVVGVDDQVITTEGASDQGMVIDFSDLKEVMMEVIDAKYDHGFAIWREDPLLPFFNEQLNNGMKIVITDFIPTAENLASCWFLKLLVALASRKICLEFVEVYETPTSMARFSRKDMDVHSTERSC